MVRQGAEHQTQGGDWIADMKRRFLLKYGGSIAAIGAVAYWQRNALARWAFTSANNSVVPTLAANAGDDVCVLMPEQIEGPYYVQSEQRADITEDRKGLPLDLTIEVVRMPDCSVVAGATVEIWHCDAEGGYSGYGSALSRAPFDASLKILRGCDGEDSHLEPVNDTTFLRGGLATDSQGRAQFQTIFPGWYEPRVAHIHLKVSKDGQSFLTTQLYFPDELAADIYANHPDYVDFGLCPYNLGNDIVIGDLEAGTGVILQAERMTNRISASIRVGIA